MFSSMRAKSCNYSNLSTKKFVTNKNLARKNNNNFWYLLDCFPAHVQQTSNEPSHEIMALFVLRKLILQTCMRSYPVGLDVWFLIGPFVYFHITCVQTAMALARLRKCTGSPEPSLITCVISTIISWAGSNTNILIMLTVQLFLTDRAEQCLNLHNSKFPFTIHCVCLV